MLAALLLVTARWPPAPLNIKWCTTSTIPPTPAMNHVNNHLNAAPDAKIVVGTNGKGIDFLLNDAKNDKGDYAATIAGLKGKGVDFRVCNNTLAARKLGADAMVPEATIVPSGVAEIGKLPAQEGYVYLPEALIDLTTTHANPPRNGRPNKGEQSMNPETRLARFTAGLPSFSSSTYWR